MAYSRKTKDEGEVQGYYSTTYGWECVTTEDTRAEAIIRLAEYLKNEPNIKFRIVKHRVPCKGGN
jgi:hypothetical protein